MRYLDYACAWGILLTAVSFMLAIEILHLRGGDTGHPIPLVVGCYAESSATPEWVRQRPGIDGHVYRG